MRGSFLRRCAVWVAMVLLCGPVMVGASELETPVAEDTSRQILVIYEDTHIGRVPVGSPGRYYGGGRDYQSSSWARRLSTSLAVDHGLTLLREWPMQSLGKHCVVYQVPEGPSVEAVLLHLQQDRRVDQVQRMNVFQVLSGDSTEPYRPLQQALDQLDVEEAHHWSTGEGVVIAVIDTGVDRQHPDLHSQLLAGGDYTQARTGDFDTDVHGTAVAGVIVARGDNQQGIIGVAPSARLLPLKACWARHPGDRAAVCNSFTLAMALEAAIQTGADVLNISLSGPSDPLLNALISQAIARDMVVVMAEPGRESEAEAGSLAAGVPHVLRVQASAANGSREARSTLTTAVEGPVSAPGSNVLTTFPGARYDFISGSSFAAAHVTGVVALLRALHPELDALQTEAILLRSDPQGLIPVVNACRAVRQLVDGGVCHPASKDLGTRPGFALHLP